MPTFLEALSVAVTGVGLVPLFVGSSRQNWWLVWLGVVMIAGGTTGFLVVQ